MRPLLSPVILPLMAAAHVNYVLANTSPPMRKEAPFRSCRRDTHFPTQWSTQSFTVLYQS